jgi:agmatinase
VRKILKAGAMPIVLGGDHAIPIPVLRAFEGRGPITLVHVDQHLDWRDEVNGVRNGLSSPIRRASEMEHIGEIFQIGLRATGSARAEEFEAAKAYGAHLISAFELHDIGMDAVLDRIPDGGRYYITIDMDGMDPSIAPAVAAPMPGGVTYLQARKLVHGLVNKGRVVGMDIVEITPRYDLNQITCITAGRLIVNLIGAAVRADYFGRH